MKMPGSRLPRHAYLVIGGAAIGLTFASSAEPRDTAQYLSLATAYTAYLFLVAAMLIGPRNIVRSGRPIISSQLRRHLGIYSGLFAILHVIAGLNVHFHGHIEYYFLQPRYNYHEYRLRGDAFGITNDIGALVTAAIILLVVLSNNFMLRTLGARRWKNLQRLSYPVFFGITLHAIIYQLIEHRSIMIVASLTAMAVLVVGAHVIGIVRYRNRQSIVSG